MLSTHQQRKKITMKHIYNKTKTHNPNTYKTDKV